MPIVANNTTILFNDSTTQTTAGASGVNTVTVANSPGTWTKPASVKSIKVTVVGGGATGGTSGAFNEGSSPGAPGGGGGGAAIKYYPAASLPGPQPYSSGGAGATSSFGAAPIGPISATGGSGATGGVGSGGTIVNALGSPGSFGVPIGGPPASGPGGDSILSGGAPTNTNAPSTSYGAGGGGGVATQGAGADPGGTGGPGVVIIEEFN